MKSIVHTDSAPRAIGPYSQAVMAGNLLFVSGQLGLDPATGKLKGASVAEQARQALENIGAILRAAGLGYELVVKTTVLLKDIADFPEVNRLYAEYFRDQYPARATYQVAALPAGGLIEIEAVACRD